MINDLLNEMIPGTRWGCCMKTDGFAINREICIDLITVEESIAEIKCVDNSYISINLNPSDFYEEDGGYVIVYSNDEVYFEKLGA